MLRESLIVIMFNCSGNDNYKFTSNSDCNSSRNDKYTLIVSYVTIVTSSETTTVTGSIITTSIVTVVMSSTLVVMTRSNNSCNDL